MEIPDISTGQIVKWVLIVLVAAFIGQFGKTFALFLMNRFRRKKADKSAAVPSAEGLQGRKDEKPRNGQTVDEVALKAQKKEAKTRLKAKKKADKNR